MHWLRTLYVWSFGNQETKTFKFIWQMQMDASLATYYTNGSIILYSNMGIRVKIFTHSNAYESNESIPSMKLYDFTEYILRKKTKQKKKKMEWNGRRTCRRIHCITLLKIEIPKMNLLKCWENFIYHYSPPSIVWHSQKEREHWNFLIWWRLKSSDNNCKCREKRMKRKIENLQ